jgi:16S rRNA (cytosine1402-N4)-methyltransferase
LAILLDMNRVHVPVLAGELIELTAPAPGDTVVDCTFGAGGHARLIADRIGPSGTLICIDRDPAAEEHFEELAREVACETRFLRMDYAEGLALLREEGLSADIVYLDLGISSMQVDARERGFSYSYDAPLDMRMDPGQALDAREIVNTWDERQLAQLFRRLGEDPNSRRIAREIVRRRERAPIQTTGELVAAIEGALPAAVRRSFGGGSPAKRVFQAVRIAVNSELDSLDRALPLAWELLRENGRLAAISFHSLEDRRVKRFLAERARGCVCPPDFPVCVCGREPEAELISGRAVVPTAGEIADNPRAKASRLRAARKLSEAS